MDTQNPNQPDSGNQDDSGGGHAAPQGSDGGGGHAAPQTGHAAPQQDPNQKQ
jgi:hypothetical protein